ncbi:exodeoxyribonuclease III [Oleiphilus sp. HI0009]|uniref:exodeoxyribonuclease III n=1 Tax=Oleiphilus sp. HI0125 TaxID=1822266 RepID=UPI0007C203D9|nr:exodeoxyribonuclease III [Oleiphilus sp. HI0125]KZX76808.1 exodeoxyribonuclease III [Oleiphilus sp. HI0009]KZZ58366.1 exodeoxyribonuclease III [Oleiphilus sp. HI0125]
MRVVSISVNGLKQAAELGFYEWMQEIDADVVCVQDIRGKVYDFDDDIYHPPGYEVYFLDAEFPEDGGVAIYTRHFPKAIMYGFAYEPADRQGRFIQADFDNVSVASMLAPGAMHNAEQQEDQDKFMEAFQDHLEKCLRKRRQFIYTGNFQSAHQVTDASKYYHDREVAGFLAHEREWFDKSFDELGYVDAFRQVNKHKGEYTYWPKEAGEEQSEAGIRTDFQITSATVSNVIEDGFIDYDTRFSDHAPVIIDYDIIM